jgi:DNA-binding CsgD family transcriptional regulator
LSNHGIDAEISFRGLIGGLTGKSGEELESLILEGLEFGRQHEADDAPTLLEIKVAGGLAVNRNARGAGELRPSEIRVLNLIADGKTVPQVAEALLVSSETVKSHVASARARLGAKTMPQAVRLAIRSGQIAA